MIHLDKVNIFPDKFPTREHYPFNLDVFQKTPGLEFDRGVVFFVGENGTGKSTLLEALARRCRIHIWRGDERTRYNVNIYEMELYRCIRVHWVDSVVPGCFFASQIFRHFSQLVDEWAAEDPGLLEYFGGQSLMDQSHGQSLMSFFRSRFRIKGLYLLDEPETALSPKKQVELLEILKEMSSAGHAQFIVATHSPILLACPDAQIYSFDKSPVGTVEYEDTEHYKLYKDFMNNKEEYL